MSLHLVARNQLSPIALLHLNSVLDRAGRRQLESIVATIEVGRRGIVVDQGDIGPGFLAVSEGMLKTWKVLPNGRRQTVAFRGPGDSVTLHRHETPWPVTVQAISDSRLHCIDGEGLRCLARRYSLIDQVLFDLACDEISDLHNRIVMLGRKTAEEKLAAFILEFCSSSALPMSLCREVYLPMRRPDIADYLGLTTESVSREFSRLKRMRLIALPCPSRVVVLNQPALEAMALGISGSKQAESRLHAFGE